MNNPALAMLRHHVTGAIARGEALPVRSDVEMVTYHRGPTASELRFGEGAIHYADFGLDICCHPGTRIAKRWFVYRGDGLRYYR